VAKGVAGASGRDAPAVAVIGIGPQQVAHWTLVRHFLETVESAYVIECVDGGRETTVQAEDLILIGKINNNSL
jgi:hypothetical protein